MPSSLRQIPVQDERLAFGLDHLLRPTARTLAFDGRPLPRELFDELRALMAVGPGMTDAAATRLVFATSAAAKARLAEALDLAGRAAALDAPACAAIAYDRDFAEQMLAFAADDGDGRSAFAAPARLRAAVLRNSVLQGAYLAVAARTLGLDLVFLAAFDAAAVTAGLFAEPGFEVIYIAALGFPAERVS
jgi:3-hydroxypropanoate dehydrogenase